MTPAPIALFAYRRRDHLDATVRSLLANPEAARTALTIFCDGARGETDAEDVAQVRAYAASITGFAAVEVVQRPRNFGLAASIIDGVTTMLARHERVIVVEDDLVVSPHFLAYMNDGLERYADDKKVASIHAYIYPLHQPVPETFFLRGADCWGWATWSRAWAHFRADGPVLLKELKARRLTRAFDFDGPAGFTEMLENQIKGLNNSWAIRWHAATFLDGMLTLYPGRSLVHNIGNDGSGTHRTDDTQNIFSQSLAQTPVSVARIPLEENRQARAAVRDYFRRVRGGVPTRILRLCRTVLKRAMGAA
ncbi:MAG: glycosyltransferase [Alphaproteobacteria bacterium]